jgi:flagellar basal body-associated protein FliL
MRFFAHSPKKICCISYILVMQIVLILLLAAAAGATLFVLVKGLVGMAQAPSELNAARSQVLMQKRVAYQTLAILFASALLALAR